MTERQKMTKKNSWLHWLIGTAVIAAVYASARSTPVANNSDPRPSVRSSSTMARGNPWITQELRKRMNKMMGMYDIPWEPENISEWGHRLNDAVRTYPWVRETEIVDCMIVGKFSDPTWEAEAILGACAETMARQ